MQSQWKNSSFGAVAYILNVDILITLLNYFNLQKYFMQYSHSNLETVYFVMNSVRVHSLLP